jgi:hypothetical protein
MASKFKTNEQFIKDAIAIHGDSYSYELCDYKSAGKKLKYFAKSIMNIFYKHLLIICKEKVAKNAK